MQKITNILVQFLKN